MKWALWLGLALLAITVITLLLRPSKSCYAPPRDENTVLPYIEPTGNVAADSQMDVYKDAAGWPNMRQHPLTDFFQENAFSNVADIAGFGSFMGSESSAGMAPMTVIPSDEQYTYTGSTITIGEAQGVTSPAIPFIGAEQNAPSSTLTTNPDMTLTVAAQPASSTSQAGGQ